MTAVVAPDVEECYLLAILDSPDGLDLAEFSWHDPEAEDGCYRAWDFQWKWYTNPDTYQVDQGARALGKTVGITMRCCQFPFSYPGQSMLLTAPELNHLRPLVDAIEGRLKKTRILRELLPKGKTTGFARQPHWQCTFENGTRLVSRLPNKDGKGVKGQHVLQIELDEAQDYPLAGWTEIVETLNRGLPGAGWRCHGVPKGTRDKFWDITEGQKHRKEARRKANLASGENDKVNEITWTVHRPMAQNRPTWGPQERDEKTTIYGGSRQSIDYKRNIYGEHGDSQSAVFVLSKLMDCVDTDEGSMYNSEVFVNARLVLETMPSTADLDEEAARSLYQQTIDNVLLVPRYHFDGWSQKVGGREVGATQGYSAYWGGMDVGRTNSPSEILLFGQRKGNENLDLLLRVHIQRLGAEEQAYVVEKIFDIYGAKLKAFGIDEAGLGWGVFDPLSRRQAIKARIYGFNFSAKDLVGFEDRELQYNETMADLALERYNLEASTDWLRDDYVHAGRMRLPFDREILLEFQGQTYTNVKDNGSPYGKRRQFGGGSFHTLDAAKNVMSAKYIPPLREILNNTNRSPVLDTFVGSERYSGGYDGGAVFL